jgi:HD superfamily phosphodiesterase
MKAQSLERHHHFRLPLIARDDHAALLEATVVEMLLKTDVHDDARDSSIAWELKHQAGVTQMARLLAARRSLDPETAAIGALLHDIYVIVTGSYQDHARRGGPIAKDMLESVGLSDAQMTENVLVMVTHHSAKEVYEDDLYAELGKDVDVLDCLLYPNAINEYLLTKPWGKVREYLHRAQKIWEELSLAVPGSFTILNDYVDGEWFQQPVVVSRAEADELEAECADGSLPYPVLLERGNDRDVVRTTTPGTAWLKARVTRMQANSFSGKISQPVVLWPHLRRSELLPDFMASIVGGPR